MFHLVKRALTSISNRPLSAVDVGKAETILLPAEFSMWQRMQNRDQRHSLDVLNRFDALRRDASRDERAAALLHDVGKCESSLGWWGRVIATIVGGRTASFRDYLNHEAIGITLLNGVSTHRTLAVLSGEPLDDCVLALRQADNV